LNPVIQRIPRRQALYAPTAMVATSQPLAAAAGLEVLRDGGNAVDAAITMAATLTVVEPTGCGLGSDLMAIIAGPAGIEGYIGSGRTPAGFNPGAFTARQSPRGWHGVTVPAAPRAWADLATRYGRLPLERLLAPAIHYAQEGFPLSPLIAAGWARAVEEMRPATRPEFAGFIPTFAPTGFVAAPGARFTNPDLAATLRSIAASRAEDFYTGALAERITRFSRDTGGWLRAQDLATHAGEWIQPQAVSFRGYRVFELPPPTQGGVALMALGLLQALGPTQDVVEAAHWSIEAIKRAFTAALEVIADGEEARAWLGATLTPGMLGGAAKGIATAAAPGPESTRLEGGTVYLAAADGDGLLVSMIQSNFMGFGSHVVVPGTGISLANRALCFAPAHGHPNAPHPARRPYNTIIPGLLADAEGCPLGPFGVMGGYMQPQGHVQVLRRLIDAGLDPQAALQAPRWRFLGGHKVLAEPGFDTALAVALARRGHDMEYAASTAGFGCGQIILRHANGYVAGSDGRADGAALGY